jgi:hypothetical protein
MVNKILSARLVFFQLNRNPLPGAEVKRQGLFQPYGVMQNIRQMPIYFMSTQVKLSASSMLPVPLYLAASG